MSIDKKKPLFHLPLIIRTPDGDNGRRLMEVLNRPHPVFVSLPMIEKLTDLPLPSLEALMHEEFDRLGVSVPLCIGIPPSLMEAAKKYNEGLQVGASLMFKALSPLTEKISMSIRESFSVVLANDEVKRLERLLQKHPQRHDIKLKILNLRREIKQYEKNKKGSKDVQQRS